MRRPRRDRRIEKYRSRGVDTPTAAYRSRLEENVSESLRSYGIEFDYEPKVFKFDLPIRGGRCTLCPSSKVVRGSTYTPDFQIRSTGTFIEAKGKFTAQNRTRMEAFRAAYPEIDLRFVFMRDNWISKKHLTKYTDWARELGIKAHVGQEIPDEWANEFKVADSGGSN